MKKFKESVLFLPILLTSLDVLFWAIFIIFNVLYNFSIDWDGYYNALKSIPTVEITDFYNGASMIFLFIGFLFLVAAIVTSIYMMYIWMKYCYHNMKKKGNINE